MNQIHPQHQQALQCLPNNFPPFFQGFAPQCFNGVQVYNIQVPHALSRAMMHYIISKANGSRLAYMLYQTMSNSNFANQEFLMLVISANRVFNVATQNGMNQQQALTECAHAACWRWIVTYAENNYAYLNLSPEENALVGKVKQFVANFEAKITGQQNNNMTVQHNPYQQPAHGGSAYGGIDVSGLFENTGGGGGDLLYNEPELPDFNGGSLNSPLLASLSSDENQDMWNDNQHASQTNDGMPQRYVPEVIINDAPDEGDFTMQENDEVVNIPIDCNAGLSEILDARNAHPVLVNDKVVVREGSIVDYNKHAKARLFNDNRSWSMGMDAALESDAAVGAIGGAASEPKPVVVDGEVTEDLGLVDTNEGKLIVTDDIILLNDLSPATVRYEMARLFYNGADAVVSCSEHNRHYPNSESIKNLANVLISSETDLQNVLDSIKDAKTCKDDPLLQAAAMDLNDAIGVQILDVLNFELHLPGHFDSFADDIMEVIKYVNDNLPRETVQHLVDAISSVIHTEGKGLLEGYTAVNSITCLTRCTAANMPYLVVGNSGIVNKDVTPMLYNACDALYKRKDTIEADDLKIHAVDIYTMDGARVSVFRSAVGDKYVIKRFA